MRNAQILGLAVCLATFGGWGTGVVHADNVDAGYDYWITIDQSTYMDFMYNPIPADFFGPGSEPFDGIIALRGEPIDPGQYGQVSTIVERLEPANVPFPPPSSDTIEIEIIALSLVSAQPIAVMYMGGMESCEYEVHVDLNPGMPSIGQMTIFHETDEGGTFTVDAVSLFLSIHFEPVGGTPGCPWIPIDWEPMIPYDLFSPDHYAWQHAGVAQYSNQGPNFFPLDDIFLWINGEFGEGVHASTPPPPPPVTGCCMPLPDCTCEDMDPAMCDGLGGTPLGHFCTYEPCCVENGDCIMTDLDCCMMCNGDPVPACEGDGNGNGVDEACEDEGSSCASPTPVNVNDTTTVVSHGGWFEFVAVTNATAIETCGSDFDTLLEVWSADCATSLATNDDCSDGNWGAGSDPNASCYQSPDAGERDSCLCLSTVPGTTYIIKVMQLGGSPPPAGSTIVLTLTKRNNCGGVPEYKWLQEPDLSTMGMDVNSSMCHYCHQFDPYLGGHRLADDFECTERSPITEIHVWGSWQNDYILNSDPGNVDFYVSIHEDIPAKPPAVPYSRPGGELWGRTFQPGDFTASLYADGIEEWWYQPPHANGGFAYFPGDTQCYEYVFDLSTTPFYQWGLPDRPVIYWLSVEAHPYPLVSDSDFFFGWKTSVDHWNDDAVYTSAPELVPEPVWHELKYPGVPVADPPHPYEGESIDLAFGIVGGDPMVFVDQVVCEPQPPDHPSTYWYEVTPGNAGRCDFHVRVYDPDPCNYSNWVMPANYVAGVHQVGDESWVSWWDPTPDCKNAFFDPTTFGFDNDNPSTWGEWATSVGNSPDPYDPGGIADTSASHSAEQDGYGYRVHVPSAPAPQPKWVQAPDMSVLGMDVGASRNTNQEHYWLADDFRCTTTEEVTEIVIWGSWFQDIYPGGMPEPDWCFFDVAIHADVPADQSPTGHSMPGAMLWNHWYRYAEFQLELCADQLEEGWYQPTYPDSGFMFPGDFTCWKYTFTIPAGNQFIQEGTPEEPVIYWLSLQAEPQPPVGLNAVFGWKSSIDHWNDDAVYTFLDFINGGSHTDWYEIIYPPTHPLYAQGHPYAGESVDLAFAIVGEAALCQTDEDCYDGDECTEDTCNDPPNGTCESTYRSRPYADVTPFGSIIPPCTSEDAATIGDGFSNMLDVYCAFNAFNEGFPYTQCPCGDISPCGGDGFVNMLDVFSAFNAFNDDPACPSPCP